MIEILEDSTKNPMQIIGKTAAVCWNSDISSTEKNFARAVDCINSGHGRVLEWPVVNLIISGYSAKCIRELMRHIIGTSVLQESTRYIDYPNKGFGYVIPKKVAACEKATEIWNNTIDSIVKGMKELSEMGVPNEDVTNLLPLCYETKIVLRVNLRALIHLMNERLCNRAYWEIRDLCHEISNALKEYSEEWNFIVKNYFVPKCDLTGFCKEKHSCGRSPHENKRIG